MTTTVDVIVLGTGSAAQAVAYACRSASWRVAVVDSRPFGGTCENRGCEPKKVLGSMAELVDWSRRTQGKGVSAPSLALNLTTSTQFLDLDALPLRIVFVGGGYIAFEFAHIAARAGAQVQVLHSGSRPLEKFDPDLVSMLVQATQEFGVEVHVNRVVTAIERQQDRLLVHARTGEQEYTVEADLVVHAAGRVPEIDDLDLEVAEVAREQAGVSVNDSSTHCSSCKRSASLP
jgi:pyruvate/2-oxoglutarate dehydrogenase complex dihydrolipoamide dehydrogenase (E3) component